MPLNKKYPLAMLLDACRSYPGTHNARRITFEYVMLKGVNDSEDDARRLIGLLKGIPAKVNLIPFNPWPGSFFECSEAATITRFADRLSAAHISAPVRSEEHTSELQSLMRNSYAVFCLKKKNSHMINALTPYTSS